MSNALEGLSKELAKFSKSEIAKKTETVKPAYDFANGGWERDNPAVQCADKTSSGTVEKEKAETALVDYLGAVKKIKTAARIKSRVRKTVTAIKQVHRKKEELQTENEEEQKKTHLLPNFMRWFAVSTRLRWIFLTLLSVFLPAAHAIPELAFVAPVNFAHGMLFAAAIASAMLLAACLRRHGGFSVAISGKRPAKMAAIIGAILFLSAPAFAIPQLVNLQGKLTDENNLLLSGQYSFEFGLYDAATGGTLEWNESKTLNVTNGIFSTLLGATKPIDLAFEKDLWLEVAVGGETLMPRFQIGSSAYAFRANITQFAIADTASDIPFIVRGAPSQSANLFVVENSSGGDLLYVDSSGNLNLTGIYYGDGSGLTGVTAEPPTSFPASNITPGNFASAFGGGDFSFARNVSISENLSAGKIFLPSGGSGANPALVFGDGDTGLYEGSDDQISLVAGGSDLLVAGPTNAYFASGKLGIGTPSPEEELTLYNGTFLQTEGGMEKLGSITLARNSKRLYVSGSYAYVTTDQGSTEDDLEIFDISNRTVITKIGGLDLGSVTNDVFVTGKYAYVTTTGGDEFRIIDISNPAGPFVVGSANISGSQANSIYVSGSYAYVGGNGADEIEIFDISNSASPWKISGLDIAAGSTNDVFVHGNYLYIATTDFAQDLKIINISDPSNPMFAGGANVADIPNGLYVSGSYAYVVSNTGSDDLEIFDISNPASPSKKGGANLVDVGTSIYVSGSYAYVTNDYNAGGVDNFEAFDVSNPASPVKVGGVDMGNGVGFGRKVKDVKISGKYAYVLTSGSTGSTQRLEIVDISGIDSPAANIGNILSNNVNVRENLIVKGNAYVDTGLNVGPSGVHSDGPVSVVGSVNITGIYYGDGSGLTGVTAEPPASFPASNITGGTFASAFGSTDFAFNRNVSIAENLSVGGNTLFVDSLNDRVGIGTTSPTQALHVEGDINVSGGSRNIWIDGDQVCTAGNGACAQPASTAAGWSNSTTEVYLADSSNNITTHQGSSSPTFFVDNTNNRVGIGTSSPATALMVNGTIQGNNGLTISSGTVNLPNGEIGNEELANSSLTVTAGTGLANGGLVQLGAGTTLNVGGGTGIVVNADDVAVNASIADGTHFDYLFINNTESAGGDLSGPFSNMQLGAGVVGTTEISTAIAGNGLTGGGGAPLAVGQGTGITVNANDVAIDTSVVPRKTVDETITGRWTFDNDVVINDNLFLLGNLTNVNVDTLNVNGSLLPFFDNTFDLGNQTNRWRNASIASNLYVDTNTLVVDAASNNVGIGTANPSTSLEIEKVTSASNEPIVVITNNADFGSESTLTLNNAFDRDIGITFQNQGTPKWSIRNDAPTATSGDDLVIDSGSLSNVFVIEQGGKVGIGTSSPATLLQVGGDTGKDGEILVSSDGGRAAVIRADDTGNFVHAGSSTDHDFRIVRNNTEMIGLLKNTGIMFSNSSGNTTMLITEDGSVGIGTTTPDGLEVQAAVTETPAGEDNVRLGMVDSPRIIFEDASENSLWEIDNFNGDMRIFQPGSVKVTIENSTGNVGIGTSNPSYKLDVDGGSGAGPWVAFEGGAAVAENTALLLWDKGTASTNVNKIDFAFNTTSVVTSRIKAFAQGTQSASGGDLAFETSSDSGSTWNTNQLYLDNGGNVGIGTGSPGSALHVIGDANISSTLMVGSPQTGTGNTVRGIVSGSGSSTQFMVENTATDGDPSLVMILPGVKAWTMGIDDSDSDKLKISDTQGLTSPRITIDTSGSVGIGTSSPSQILHVIGATCIEPSDSGCLTTSSGTTTGGLYINDQDSIYFENGKHAITYNDGDGNFNIRIGHISNSSGGEEVTEAGYPSHMEWSQTSGWWQLNMDNTSRSVGDTASWSNTIQFDKDGLFDVSGRVEVGTGSPGNATGTGDIYASSDIEYDGNLYGPGADVAEKIRALGTPETGDVVEISADTETVEVSSSAYNTRAAGIVSDSPGIILSKATDGVSLAIAGRVPVKASAENGAIIPGDLLTTSSTPGHAMRCDNIDRCRGSIVAKSLGYLDEGTGTIPVLVMLA